MIGYSKCTRRLSTTASSTPWPRGRTKALKYREQWPCRQVILRGRMEARRILYLIQIIKHAKHQAYCILLQTRRPFDAKTELASLRVAVERAQNNESTKNVAKMVSAEHCIYYGDWASAELNLAYLTQPREHQPSCATRQASTTYKCRATLPKFMYTPSARDGASAATYICVIDRMLRCDDSQTIWTASVRLERNHGKPTEAARRVTAFAEGSAK